MLDTNRKNSLTGSDGGEFVSQCSQEKYQQRMKKLNENISRIIEKADVNNDGVVSYTEFLFAMSDGSLHTDGIDQSMYAYEKERLMANGGATTYPSALHISASVIQAEQDDKSKFSAISSLERQHSQSSDIDNSARNRRSSDSDLRSQPKIFKQKARSELGLDPKNNPRPASPSDNNILS